MDTIAKQKALADRVYAILGDHYDILLAGGAPRDWHIGQEARDLDFYIFSVTPEGDFLDVAERLGVELNPLGDKQYEELMDGEPDLRGVFEGEMYGQKVQFMFVALNPLQFVKEKFDLSICKVWYKDGEICMDWEARLSLREKIVVMKDGFNRYADKLMMRQDSPWHTFAFLGSWKRALDFMEQSFPGHNLHFNGAEDEIDLPHPQANEVAF
tara:strand:+ start:749 stop:1384 length:636 start_codon:yes stop_codon:yes gene_type:complete